MEYEQDAEGNEKYDTDAATNNEIVKAAANRYARDKHGNSFYPRDNNNNEMKDPVFNLIQNKDGKYILPVNSLGQPIYDKQTIGTNTKELYPKINEKFIIGTGIDGNEYYAKDENSDEYYPDNKTIAHYNDGHKRYAEKSTSETIFPKDDTDNEMYLEEVNPCHTVTIPSRYAKDSNLNEFYPKTITADNYISDAIIHEAYAKDSQNKPFYPKDAFGNEFYLPEKDSAGAARTAALMVTVGTPVRYAVTHDAKMIVPSINNAAAKIAAPDITTDEIIGRLIREGTQSSDFLTMKDSDPALKSLEPINYRYRDNRFRIRTTEFLNAKDPKRFEKKCNVVQSTTAPSVVQSSAATIATPFFKTWSFWILVIVSLIIKSLAIWWFFFRNKISYISTR